MATQIEYTSDTRRLIGDAIENCLFTFNMMHGKWGPKKNIDAARDSILSEIEHILEFEPTEEGE